MYELGSLDNWERFGGRGVREFLLRLVSTRAWVYEYLPNYLSWLLSMAYTLQAFFPDKAGARNGLGTI